MFCVFLDLLTRGTGLFLVGVFLQREFLDFSSMSCVLFVFLNLISLERSFIIWLCIGSPC